MRNDQGVPLLTVTEFARVIGVSQPAISKAIQAGRLQPYNEAGCPVSAGFRGRKFLKLEEARRSFDESRIRFDDRWL